MAQLIVRNLDEGLKAQIAMQARHHGHSMEEEVRQIIARALNNQHHKTGELLHAYFKDIAMDAPLERLPYKEMRTPDFLQ